MLRRVGRAGQPSQRGSVGAWGPFALLSFLLAAAIDDAPTKYSRKPLQPVRLWVDAEVMNVDKVILRCIHRPARPSGEEYSQINRCQVARQ